MKIQIDEAHVKQAIDIANLEKIAEDFVAISITIPVWFGSVLLYEVETGRIPSSTTIDVPLKKHLKNDGTFEWQPDDSVYVIPENPKLKLQVAELVEKYRHLLFPAK